MLDEQEQHKESNSVQTDKTGHGDWIYWTVILFYSWLILYSKVRQTGSWSFPQKALFIADFALGEKNY